jgi:hypothetical protein
MANRIREEVSKRSESAKHYLNDDGSYTAEIGAGAIHYEHTAGDWRDIDTTVVVSDDPDYDFMCVTTDIPTYFKKEISGTADNVKIVKGGVTVKIKSGTSLKLSDSNSVKTDKALTKSKPEKVTGKTNKIRYPSIHSQGNKHLDIDYDVIAGKLHEEFICSESMGFPEITQEIELSGGYAVQTGKQILIKSNATNEIVLTIPAPVMFEQDTPAEGSYDLDYEITGSLTGTFQITKVLEPAGKTWFFAPERVYPLVVDTDFAISRWALVYGQSDTYSTARSTPTGRDNNLNYYTGQNLATGTYTCYSNFLRFDTSSIGTTSSVTGVTLRGTVADKNVTTDDFNVLIKDYSWASYDPIDDANQQAAYTGNFAAPVDQTWFNTSAASNSAVMTSPSLNNSWVNKSGYTYYGYLSSRIDNGNAPTAAEYFTYYQNSVILAVTYTAIVAPTVNPGVTLLMMLAR